VKNQPYNNFWQHLHKSAKEKNFPLRVMFELTYRCNFSCKHCYVPLKYQKYKELKTKEIFLILDQLADLGCFYLGFTGGEPFIRKDALDIFRYAKKKGFEVIIYSNGSLISAKIAEELARLRLNKVDITIPAMRRSAFEKITGLVGSHDKVFKTIERLRKNRVNLGFKTCALKENQDEIEDIENFAGSLGVLHRLDDMFFRRLDGSNEPFKFRGRLKLGSSQKAEVGSKETVEDCNVTRENREPCLSGRQARTENLFKCGVGQTQAAITPCGELKMCLMIDYPRYNILKSSFKECWRKLKNDVSKIKPDSDCRCDECALQSYCKWCPARGWLYNKRLTSCDPQSRRKAESIRELLR